MPTPPPATAAFKRQVVFRLAADEWPLLQTAVQQHGSIQAAVTAGLRALADLHNTAAAGVSNVAADASPAPPADTTPRLASDEPARADEEPDAEITAREAAKILGLKTSTISSYIRSGRLPGHYRTQPRPGWITTRAAITTYRERRP